MPRAADATAAQQASGDEEEVEPLLEETPVEIEGNVGST